MDANQMLPRVGSHERRETTVAIVIGCALLVLTLASCGGGSPAPPPPPPTTYPSITLSPSSASLPHSLTGPSTAQFHATVENAADATIDWSLADAQSGSPYDVGTISPTGLYTAPERGLARTVKLTAALHSNPSYRATATIELRCTSSVALTTPEGTSVMTNRRLRLGVQAQSSCESDPGVTWKLNGAASGNSMTGYIVPEPPAGVWFYAPAAAPASAVTITAVSQTDAQRSASVAVTVTPDQEALVISPAEVNVSLGAAQPFVVTRGGRETAVSWRVNFSEEADARVGWMRGATYTAPFTVPNPAQVVVTAADTSSTPNRFASALVTVTAPAANANHRLQGTYAALLTGEYAYWLGTITFDGKGFISGTGKSGNVLELQTFVSATESVFTGKIYSGTMSGSYEAGWDGQVVIRASLPGSFEESWNLAFYGPDHAEGTGSGLQVLERQDPSALVSPPIPATYRLSYNLYGYNPGGPGGGCYFCPAWIPPHTTFSARSGIMRADATGRLVGEFEPGVYASDRSLVPMTGTYTPTSAGVGSATLDIADQPPSDSVSTLAISADKFLFAGFSPLGTFAVGVATRQPPEFVLSGAYVFQTENQLVRFEADGAGHIRGVLDQAVFNLFSGSWDWATFEDAPFQATYNADSYGRITMVVTDAPFGKPTFILVPVASDRFLVSVAPPAASDLGSVSAGSGEGYALLSASTEDIVGRYGIRGLFGGLPGGWILVDGEQLSVGLTGDQQPIRFQFTPPTPDSTAKASIRHLWPDFAYGVPATSSYYAASPDILLLRGAVLEKIKW